MRAVVTGAAGFIGSHVAERCIQEGWEVVGVDAFTDYYDRDVKVGNVEQLRSEDRFSLVEIDLGVDDLDRVLDGADVVFHQAGQPGVRDSWAEGFGAYLDRNVRATQRLLEASVGRPLQRFVFASSSSVYGSAETFPTTEETRPAPHSPYGVTKLAAEHLASLYGRNFGVPTVSLRYFTVYGPRQRPDMATHRLLSAGLRKEPFHLFGSGDAVRDFTFVGDVVDANILAATTPLLPPSLVFNIAGGGSVSMNQLIDAANDAVGTEIDVRRTGEVHGDVSRTEASTELARRTLGWAPSTGLAEGLRQQTEELVRRLD